MVSAIHQHASATGTRVPHYEPPSYLPLHPITLDCPRALTLSAMLHASNLHWSSVLHMVIYMLQCYSLISSQPRLLPHSPIVCSLCLCLFSFRLTSLCIIGSSFIHLIRIDSNVCCFFFLIAEK